MKSESKSRQKNKIEIHKGLASKELTKQLNSLFRSMDFVNDNFLAKEKIGKKELEIYFNIYQQLGLAWEFLGLQCKHWDGYKKIRDKKEACKICGKIKGINESYILLPYHGIKKIGVNLRPNSKKTFETKKDAEIVNDSINFHGVSINVDVHNSYKSKFLKDKINMAAERIITLRDGNVECVLDEHLVSIKLLSKDKARGKKEYGEFPWEISKKNLKNFPVIFDFDDKYKFLGLTIFK